MDPDLYTELELEIIIQCIDLHMCYIDLDLLSFIIMAEQATFTPLETVSKVEISVRCTNLKDLDVFSKSDPVVFLYERLSPSAAWNKLGKTEVVDNNLNPQVCICTRN